MRAVCVCVYVGGGSECVVECEQVCEQACSEHMHFSLNQASHESANYIIRQPLTQEPTSLEKKEN